MIKIFDTHAHYDDDAFDDDRELLIGSFLDNNVKAAVNIGVDLRTSLISNELTKKYDFMYGTVGVHPSEATKVSNGDIEKLEEIAKNNKKIVAVGEIGLDYHYEDTDKPCQKEIFVECIDLARRLSLPMSIHSRDAAKDTIDIMKAEKSGDIGGVVHCYSYSVEMAREYLDMDFYFGIGGVVTFKNSKKLREVVEYVPLDKLVLETDSPYLAPEPFRGKRNCSIYLTYVAEKIAELKNISVDEVYDATWKNAMRLYRIMEA